ARWLQGARGPHRAHAAAQALDRLENLGPVAMSHARHVAVVGAGYAGLAAAVALVRTGCAVTLFEANLVAGGRARRIEYRDSVLDTGQHLLLGGYRSTLALMREIGVSERAFERRPLTLVYPQRLRIAAPKLPAPLNLLAALLFAQGLSWRERWAAIR